VIWNCEPLTYWILPPPPLKLLAQSYFTLERDRTYHLVQLQKCATLHLGLFRLDVDLGQAASGWSHVDMHQGRLRLESLRFFGAEDQA
jgi:hypothetical protein